MELISVVLLSLAYLVVGGLVTGVLTKVCDITYWSEEQVLFVVFAFILWPVTLVALLVYAFGKTGVSLASWILGGKKK